MIKAKTILGRLERMVRLYQRCLELTVTAVNKDSLPDMDALTRLFERRTGLLAKAERIENTLATREEKGRKRLAGIPKDQEKRAEKLLGELAVIMNGLLESDQKLKTRLEEELTETGQEIGRVTQGLSVLKAYTPYRGGVSYYISRRG